MDISKMYSKRVSKLFKSNHDKDISKFESEFLPIFIDCFRALPEEVSREIYSKFVEFSNREFKEALYNLVNVFELFEENYDVENDPLNSEEWEYIKLLVNDSSEDIELEDMKYIMQVMLDLGYI